MKFLEKKVNETATKIIECMDKKFGRSSLEKMNECLDNWLEFREGYFVEEND